MTQNDISKQTKRISIPIKGAEAVRERKKPAVKGRGGKITAVCDTLSNSEYKLYSEFMRSIYDALVITDLSGNIVDANSRAVEFFNYELDELSALSIFDLIHGLEHSLLRQISHNLDIGKFTVLEAYCARKDNTYFPSEIAIGTLHFGKDVHLCFFIRDISKRKESKHMLQKDIIQLARAKRLEMAANVAGSIAHDFNNLLTPLLVYPALIKNELAEGSEARKNLEDIEKTAKQMAGINQQLLTLSRRGGYKETLITINLVIQDVIDLLKQIGNLNGITIKQNLDEHLPFVLGASDQLLRVFGNICRNAIEAMGKKGTLMIETDTIYLQVPLKHYDVVKQGEYVKVVISDTGSGIPAELQEKVFDTFFSTKKANHLHGTGLGLSIVHGIVEDHKGYIDLESKVGEGTTFTLYFPVVRKDLKGNTSDQRN